VKYRKYWFSEILKAFLVPTILIIITIITLVTFIDINNQETSHIVIGIMLGVILGFTADLIKRGLDDLNKLQKMRKISFRLLEEDAEDIYRIVWLWSWNWKFSHKSDLVQPEFNLKYWNLLKQDKEFLMLGVNEPFNEIFKMMWNFEKINYQTKLAKKVSRKTYLGNQSTFYQLTILKNAHKKLLLMFKTEKEIKEIDKKYAERKKA